MSYIGNEPPDTGAYGVESFDGGGTSFTLSKPSTPATVLLFIDGVRQTPVDAYSVSGVTLTTTATTPSGTDNVTVQFLGDVVDFGEPSDDSVGTTKIKDDAVTTDKILDDAVTADKLANSINTEIAANTAKVTNATHTGDVTGATALTIAADAVDIAMLSATGTADATTFLRGDNAWAAAGGTNTPAFFASLATSQTLSDNVATKITIGNERVASDDYDSSTNYRFTPTTAGTYYIFATCVVERTNWMYRGQIYIKKNGSSWVGNTGQGNSSYPIGKISPVAVAMDTANGTGDYYEVFYWADTYDGNDANCYGDNEAMVFTSFGAFRLLT